MNWFSLELTLGLIAVATLFGISFKLTQGRGHAVMSQERIDLAKLKGKRGGKVVKRFGSKATTVLFSTAYCAICPSVNRQLVTFESSDPGLQHIEVDITDRLDLAAHFGISQTPTVFITDPEGLVKFRVSGAPKPGVLARELNELGVRTR